MKNEENKDVLAVQDKPKDTLIEGELSLSDLTKVIGGNISGPAIYNGRYNPGNSRVLQSRFGFIP